MPGYRLLLAYDGTGFHGYARQPGVRTVQGVLEEALTPIAGSQETFVAGRTDKGVHAAGQVVSFTTGEPVDPARIRRSINRRLGPEVSVLGVTEVADTFHARFSATGRAYRYLILNREPPDPFRTTATWHFPHPLDVAAMNEASSAFVGEQDFASLCRKAGDRSTVRDVFWAWWRRDDDLVEFSVAASAFCHQMVRSMVAIAVDVGRGRVDAASIPTILAARDRDRGRGAAPAQGLTLVAVSYPGEPLPRPPWVPGMEAAG